MVRHWTLTPVSSVQIRLPPPINYLKGEPNVITVGTKTKNKKYGTGICLKVDPKDNFMTYYFSFSDGTHIWLPKNYFYNKKKKK